MACNAVLQLTAEKLELPRAQSAEERQTQRVSSKSGGLRKIGVSRFRKIITRQQLAGRRRVNAVGAQALQQRITKFWIAQTQDLPQVRARTSQVIFRMSAHDLQRTHCAQATRALPG